MEPKRVSIDRGYTLADNPVRSVIELADALMHPPFDAGTENFQASNLEVTTIDTGNRALDYEEQFNNVAKDGQYDLVFVMGWELVGLSSYLLIGFWFEKREYAAAAKKDRGEPARKEVAMAKLLASRAAMAVENAHSAKKRVTTGRISNPSAV